MTATAYPLQWPDGWPRTPDDQRSSTSQFKTTFGRALYLLRYELQQLGAGNVVISSWLPLRRDGLPREDQARRNLPDPGVAVYFTRRRQQLAIARDAFTTVHDNLRSLGLAIEAMRALERHGGGQMLERSFAGFTALPPPRSCWEILGIGPDATAVCLGDPQLGADLIGAAFRRRAAICHPDREGGSTEAMAELNRARDDALALLQKGAGS